MIQESPRTFDGNKKGLFTRERQPKAPAFQRVTLKSWEWAWGRGYATPEHCLFCSITPLCTLSFDSKNVSII